MGDDGKVTTANPIDPTANVIALNEAANKRQDDLREAAEKLFQSKIDAVNKRIDDAIERFDSLRGSDREDIKKTAASVDTTASTLRTQVETTAKAKDEQFTAFQSEMYKRLSAVELGASASGAGTAGEKSGRVSQQQLIQWFIGLVVAAIVIGGAVIGIAFAIRKG